MKWEDFLYRKTIVSTREAILGFWLILTIAASCFHGYAYYAGEIDGQMLRRELLTAVVQFIAIVTVNMLISKAAFAVISPVSFVGPSIAPRIIGKIPLIICLLNKKELKEAHEEYLKLTFVPASVPVPVVTTADAAAEAEQEARRKQEEKDVADRAFWASPEGRKVKAAQMLAEIEGESEARRLVLAEEAARLRLAEHEYAFRTARQIADEEEARKEREYARLKELKDL